MALGSGATVRRFLLSSRWLPVPITWMDFNSHLLTVT